MIYIFHPAVRVDEFNPFPIVNRGPVKVEHNVDSNVTPGGNNNNNKKKNDMKIFECVSVVYYIFVPVITVLIRVCDDCRGGEG